MNLDTYALTLDLREQEIGRCKTALRQLWAAQDAGAHVILAARTDPVGTGLARITGKLSLIYVEQPTSWTVMFDSGQVGSFARPTSFTASNQSLTLALSEFGQRDLPPEIRTVLQAVARATEAA